MVPVFAAVFGRGGAATGSFGLESGGGIRTCTVGGCAFGAEGAGGATPAGEIPLSEKNCEMFSIEL